MKKFMIGLLFIILLSTTLSANAETVVLKANSYDKIRDAYFDYHNIHVLSNQEGNFFGGRVLNLYNALSLILNLQNPMIW